MEVWIILSNIQLQQYNYNTNSPRFYVPAIQGSRKWLQEEH